MGGWHSEPQNGVPPTGGWHSERRNGIFATRGSAFRAPERRIPTHDSAFGALERHGRCMSMVRAVLGRANNVSEDARMTKPRPVSKRCLCDCESHGTSPVTASHACRCERWLRRLLPSLAFGVVIRCIFSGPNAFAQEPAPSVPPIATELSRNQRTNPERHRFA